MINYEELEDAALFGIEESLNNGGEGLFKNETCYLENDSDVDWQGSEVAEAIYAKYMGWA